MRMLESAVTVFIRDSCEHRTLIVSFTLDGSAVNVVNSSDWKVLSRNTHDSQKDLVVAVASSLRHAARQNGNKSLKSTKDTDMANFWHS